MLSLLLKIYKSSDLISIGIEATVLSGPFGSGRTFYACDRVTCRRFLVDAGAQISVILLTPSDRRFRTPGVHLQAVNSPSISTFVNISLTVDTGRRSLSWISVITDVPRVILDLDFPADFDLLVNCRRCRLFDLTIGLSFL
nr:unnamed protein product [Spirometra erinaceieuropaei]